MSNENESDMTQPYRLEFVLRQVTNGRSDNITRCVEGSDELAVHLIKTKVFSKHATAALQAIVDDMVDAGLSLLEHDAGNTLPGSKGREKK